jgi:replicative DNA helicase
MEIANTEDLNWFRAYLGHRKTNKLYTPTGFTDLDRYIDGFYPGTLVVIGARPGKGKTTFILNLMTKLRKNHRILYFSTETSKERILERMVSIEFGIPYKDIRVDIGSNYKKIIDCIREYEGSSNVSFVDLSNPSMDQIKRAIDVVEPQLVFVDYFQNLCIQQSAYGSSAGAYARAVQQLADLAREKNITVVLTSQLKRFNDDRDNDRPKLSDFKETGKLEEAAHTAILLYHNVPRDDKLKLAVEKNRDGEIGELELLGLWDFGRLISEEV